MNNVVTLIMEFITGPGLYFLKVVWAFVSNGYLPIYPTTLVTVSPTFCYFMFHPEHCPGFTQIEIYWFKEIGTFIFGEEVLEQFINGPTKCEYPYPVNPYNIEMREVDLNRHRYTHFKPISNNIGFNRPSYRSYGIPVEEIGKKITEDGKTALLIITSCLVIQGIAGIVEAFIEFWPIYPTLGG